MLPVQKVIKYENRSFQSDINKENQQYPTWEMTSLQSAVITVCVLHLISPWLMSYVYISVIFSTVHQNPLVNSNGNAWPAFIGNAFVYWHFVSFTIDVFPHPTPGPP